MLENQGLCWTTQYQDLPSIRPGEDRPKSPISNETLALVAGSDGIGLYHFGCTLELSLELYPFSGFGCLLLELLTSKNWGGDAVTSEAMPNA